jgi:hypothetical protein
MTFATRQRFQTVIFGLQNTGFVSEKVPDHLLPFGQSQGVSREWREVKARFGYFRGLFVSAKGAARR